MSPGPLSKAPKPGEEKRRPAAERPPRRKAARTPKQRAVQYGATAVAVLAFGFTAYYAVSHLRGPRFEGVSVSGEAAELPVGKVERLGRTAHARLEDPEWLQLSDDVRTAQLRAAFDALQAKGITSFAILDDEGVVRAAIQASGPSADERVSFY